MNSNEKTLQDTEMIQNFDKFNLSKDERCGKIICQNGHPCSSEQHEPTPCPTCIMNSNEKKLGETEIIQNFDKFNMSKDERCGKIICQNGHPCSSEQHEPTPCPTCTIDMYISYDCGHNALIPCHLNRGPPYDKCQAICTLKAGCGHTIKVPCWKLDWSKPQDEANLMQFCKRPCQYEFPKDKFGCGHICSGTCSDCSQGKFHIRCAAPCEKTLVCGHICHHPCSAFCPPCSQRCQMYCDHGKCKKNCGIPCEPCVKPCKWSCPHQSCTKKCFEICDRGPCNEPCPNKLKCGHNCIGFCGEICPAFCTICNKEELLPGLILSKDEVEENDKFIYLPKCGHTIEVDMLTAWMESIPDDGEIIAKTCPLCTTRIFNCHRFNYILKDNEAQVAKVKEYINGSKLELVKELLDYIKVMDQKINGQVIFKKICGFISHITISIGNHPTLLNKMCLNSLRYLIDVWHTGESAVLESRRKHSGLIAKEIQDFYNQFYDKLIQTKFPIHMNQMLDFGCELRRLHDYFELCNRYIKTANGVLLRNENNFMAFEDVKKCLGVVCKFSEEEEVKFREKLSILDAALKCTLEITESERHEIVNAMGSTGRWFKCPNNHVYVVTECGGVTQTAKCAECNELIGGADHRVLATNALATEMDGATTTLYPRALH